MYSTMNSSVSLRDPTEWLLVAVVLFDLLIIEYQLVTFCVGVLRLYDCTFCRYESWRKEKTGCSSKNGVSCFLVNNLVDLLLSFADSCLTIVTDHLQL